MSAGCYGDETKNNRRACPVEKGIEPGNEPLQRKQRRNSRLAHLQIIGELEVKPSGCNPVLANAPARFYFPLVIIIFIDA